jgi:hypothetical protein
MAPETNINNMSYIKAVCIKFLLLKGYILKFRKSLKSDLNQAKSCSKSVNETDPFQLLLDFKYSQTLSHYVVSSHLRLGEVLTHYISGDRH